MDKNEREKNFLYEWGIENNTQYCFSTIDKEKKSYFTKRENKPNSFIREYGFETLPELIKELDALWENDETFGKIMKIIGIAAIKNKPSDIIHEKVETEDKMDTEDKLPTFVYDL